MPLYADAATGPKDFPAAAVYLVADGRQGTLLQVTARLVQLQAVVMRHMWTHVHDCEVEITDSRHRH